MEAYFEILKQSMVSKKIIHYLCENRIEKSVLGDHRLSSLHCVIIQENDTCILLKASKSEETTSYFKVSQLLLNL